MGECASVSANVGVSESECASGSSVSVRMGVVLSVGACVSENAAASVSASVAQVRWEC